MLPSKEWLRGNGCKDLLKCMQENPKLFKEFEVENQNKMKGNKNGKEEMR